MTKLLRIAGIAKNATRLGSGPPPHAEEQPEPSCPTCGYNLPADGDMVNCGVCGWYGESSQRIAPETP